MKCMNVTDIGLLIIVPSLSHLNTLTMTALSWIHEGGAALFPCPKPIM